MTSDRSPNALRRLRLATLGLFLSLFLSVLRADYYVAPNALGTGAGTSAANAADYLNATFWGTVQTALQTAGTTVWFANGTYTEGTLTLQNRGHPINRCILRATTDGSVTLKADGLTNILWLRGSQNYTLRGFRFTGTATQSALNLSYYPNPTKAPTRNINVNNCWFENLTNLSLGAILFGANRDITIDTCNFTNVTGPAPAQVHGIYAGNSSQNITINNCNFTDIGGEYVRFRNDTEYAVVTGCFFRSNVLGCNQPFIGVPLYNSVGPYANEFYGGHFQFSGNDFRYVVAQDLSGYYRYAHYFYNSGYNTPQPGDGLDYMLDSTEANTLNNGTVAQKEALLNAEMGLSNTQIKIYGNTYNGVVWAAAYRGYGTDNQGYTTPVNISNWPGTSTTFGAAPLLRNSTFEFKGNRLRCWYTYSGNAPADHPGLNGTAKAIKLASASNTEFGQWLRGPTASTATLHCLFAVGSTPLPAGVVFQMQMYHNEQNNSHLAFAVNNTGQLGYMNGTTFVAVPELGSIAFSVDANGDGDYADAGDTMRWYQLRITADYSGATPQFSIARGVANTQSDYTYSKSGITAWVNGAPATGSKIGLLVFKNTGANAVVDEVW
ncbi:MAG: hypothetical protein HZA31_10320 [Opitutae bacterium]|nr:hypothetical protein [Opitutae bacterium]